jgi:hypothetical protein
VVYGSSIPWRVRHLLPVFVLAVSVAAVSSSALARPAAPPLKRYALPRFGVSFAVPAAWAAHDERDPGFHQLFGGAFGPHVRFAAGDENSGRFTMNFTVEVVSAEPGRTLREHARSVIYGWRADPKVTIVGSPSDFVRLAGGRAWRLRARIYHVANDGDTISLLQYHFFRDKRVYIFTYQILQTLEAKYAPTFEQSARSIRFNG